MCMQAAPVPAPLGCACRSAGAFAHVECLARFARETGEWRECRTCRKAYTGAMFVGLAEARWGRARRLGTRTAEYVGAARQLASSHAERGRYSDAVRLARAAHAAAVAAFGENDDASVAAAAELGNALQLAGQLGEAIAVLEGVVATVEGANGAGEALMARASLASCLCDRGEEGDLLAAERAQRAAVEGATRALGARHTSTLMARGDLALTMSERGEHAAAMRAFDALVPELEAELGAAHPTTVVTLGNMAKCLADAGDARAAEAVLARVVPLARRVFGAVHPNTRVARRNLARARATIRKRRTGGGGR